MYPSSTLREASSALDPPIKAKRKRKVLLYISMIGLLILSILIAISIGILFILISKEEKELTLFDEQMYAEIDSVFNDISSQVDNKKKELEDCFTKMELLAPKNLYDDKTKDNYKKVIEELGMKYDLEKDKVIDAFYKFRGEFESKINEFQDKFQTFTQFMGQVPSKEDITTLLNEIFLRVKDTHKQKFEFDANHCVSKEYLDYLLQRGSHFYNAALAYWESSKDQANEDKCQYNNYTRCSIQMDLMFKNIEADMEAMLTKLKNHKQYLEGLTYLQIEGKASVKELWPTHSFRTIKSSIKIKTDKDTYLDVDVKQFVE